MMDPIICWSLGPESQLRLIGCRGQQPGIGSAAPVEHIVLKEAIGEDGKYGASLKIEGRKKSLGKNPRASRLSMCLSAHMKNL